MSTSTRLLQVFGSITLLAAPLAADRDRAFVQNLNNIKTVASTVPPNGDVNPYGVAIVPVTQGSLVARSVLVSNFNNSQNLQANRNDD